MVLKLGDHALATLLIAILAIPIFLFTLFPLISSTRPSLDGIYLISLPWNPGTFRIGYYGLCWQHLPSSGGDNYNICTGTTARSAKSIASSVLDTNDSASIATIQFALDLQRKVFVAFMTAGGLVWLISLILVALVVVAKGNAGKSWRVVATWSALVSAILMLASAWSTTSAARALEVAGQNDGISGGNLLIALQWVAAVLAFGHAWAVSRVCKGESKGAVYSYNMGR